MFINKKAVMATAATLVVLGGGTAFAYWTAQGSGTGTGTNSDGVNDEDLVLSTEELDGLYPGAEIEYTAYATNNGDEPVSVENFTVDIDSLVPAECLAEWFTVTDVDPVLTEVDAGEADVQIGTFKITFENEPLINQDDCKGATINVVLATASAI